MSDLAPEEWRDLINPGAPRGQVGYIGDIEELLEYPCNCSYCQGDPPPLSIELVHKVDWASQPDLLFRCDGTWETPSWTQPQLPPGVHLADDGRFYTFDEGSITCPACRAAPPRSPEP